MKKRHQPQTDMMRISGLSNIANQIDADERRVSASYTAAVARAGPAEIAAIMGSIDGVDTDTIAMFDEVAIIGNYTQFAGVLSARHLNIGHMSLDELGQAWDLAIAKSRVMMSGGSGDVPEAPQPPIWRVEPMPFDVDYAKNKLRLTKADASWTKALSQISALRIVASEAYETRLSRADAVKCISAQVINDRMNDIIDDTTAHLSARGIDLLTVDDATLTTVVHEVAIAMRNTA